MPQLRLDYTANVIEKNDFPALFKKCHEILATTLPTKINSCKSRAMLQEDYYIGDGDTGHAFVCLQLQIMAGRPKQVRDEVVHLLLDVFKDHFSESLKQLKLQITIELQELSEELYFKFKT
ncbi:MAG: 5-carboxymethyl-2-hydroxymuconate Delta-isomerase [Legionellales bacterium]|jgi:5-carboxymethyl-2-hydroxymuconate isomerase